MPFANATQAQQKNFEAVLAGLRRIGYGEDLLRRGYSLHDWFDPGRPSRQVDAAAFGQTPVSYDNACFAVLKANGMSGPHLIFQYRALGAPRAFEIRHDRILHWKVTPVPSDRDLRESIEPGEIERAFEANEGVWNPKSVLRARNIAAPGPRQLDFIDLGLIPALEQHIREKLDPLLGEIIHTASKDYQKRHRRQPDWDQLCRLVFRTLAGKMMHDRGLSGFRFIQGVPGTDELLSKVERHYRDQKPVTDDPDTRTLVVQRMWGSISFENLSVEVLAYIWENTLVSSETRKELGIHATPPSIARYIVHRLPIEDIPQDERHVVELCCGSGTFLIAALQRLRELLPAEMDARQRHTYLAEHLAGFDVETFGLEVARSSLTLADFPNPNGWKLANEDVFNAQENAPGFHRSISSARVVLCNPPFGTFDEKERQHYNLQSLQKPAELLLRISRLLPKEGLVGFVFPRVFLDGRGYRDVRKAVVERFEQVELVSLPDKIFEHAQQETALLIARTPRRTSGLISVFHRKVADADASSFKSHYRITREDHGELSQDAASRTIAIPDLQEIWEHLSGYPTLRDATREIHRGIEWKIPLTEQDPKTGKRRTIPENVRRLVSQTPKPGFCKGIREVPRDFFCFQVPNTCYLNLIPEYQRGNAYGLAWEEGKVVFNSKRKSRGPWRLVAFADTSGLAVYQALSCAWPCSQWKLHTLAAVLNGSVVNAYVASHEGNRDITKETLLETPVPDVALLDQEQIGTLMTKYLNAVTNSLLNSRLNDQTTARKILRQIDAIVLKAYGFPPRLERDLLEYFRGHRRPVPFDFGDYYPEGFKPYIPLWMFDSEEFQKSTAERFMAELPKVTDPNIREILADL
jgi:predicted RNA methylase